MTKNEKQEYRRSIQPLYAENATCDVVLDGIDGKLIEFVGKLARLHQGLFNSPLLIVRGINRGCRAEARHGEGKAIDIEVPVVGLTGALLFSSLVTYCAPTMDIASAYGVAERGSGYIHLEVPRE